MRKILSSILICSSIVLALLLAPSACKREPVYYGDLYIAPDDGGNNGGVQHPCSPDSVYFEQQVLPILRSNCAMSDCHDAASHEDGVILESYASVRNTGGIKLNNPANSDLYKALIDNDPDDRMPPAPRSPLTADQRALVLKWIQQGAQDLHCDAACDTTNVTFSGVIKPLITTKCVGCHSASNPGGGIKLTSYTEIKTQVNNQKLWGAINHLPGYKPMPYPAGGPKMPQCELDQIRIWIQAGALDN